mgnify:CR=1 FL=1
MAYYLENLLRHDMLHDLSAQTCGTERVNGAGKSLLNNLPAHLKSDFVAGSIAAPPGGGGRSKKKIVQKGGGREIKFIQGCPSNFDMAGMQDIILDKLTVYNGMKMAEIEASNNQTYKKLLNNSILDFIKLERAHLPQLFEVLVRQGITITSEDFL